MKVLVLCGGPSAERNVSLVSGNAVAEALRRAGHIVTVEDVAPDSLSALTRPYNFDVVFPALHGAFGEDGKLQTILEKRELAFVGSGSKASEIGMDKAAAKALWSRNDLPTPRGIRAFAVEPDSNSLSNLSFPCVVKPIAGGSSIGVSICKTRDEAASAAKKIIESCGSALIEEYVRGTELTIGFLNDKPLPRIRIETSHEFFDFEAKYHSDQMAKHHFDTGLSAEVEARCVDVATKAYKMVGCRDLCRVDLIVTEDGNPKLLEINTMPGLTCNSLWPDAVRQAGLGFPQVCDMLVKVAAARHAVESCSF